MDGQGVDQVEEPQFQFEIEAVFLVDGQGTAISGLVQLGAVAIGAAVDIHGLHAKRQATVGAIVQDGDRLETAELGDHCTLLLEDLSPGHIASGMLVTHRGGERHKELRGRSHRQYQGLSVTV
ncbi:MAG: hypothetical protein FWG16_07340 [Micrococcales bacterium]|nr:hypothetical protein [Micrococcales bacterium]